MKIVKKKFKGFGLIETLVACAILMIICGALLTINLIITKNIAFARGRAVAYNLSQEAIESARQIRDSNLIDSNQSTSWNYFICNQSTAPYLSAPVTTGSTIYYKITPGIFLNCYGANPRITMVVDPSSVGEPITVGSITYTRKIHFLTSGLSPRVVDLASHDVTEENAIRMVVEINWNDSGNSRHVEVAELLTNWKRGF